MLLLCNVFQPICLTKTPLTMASQKTASILARLESVMGIEFVENLYQDFLDTQAFASFAHHTSLLQGAYAAIRTAPDFAAEVRTAGEIYLSSKARKVAFTDCLTDGMFPTYSPLED